MDYKKHESTVTYQIIRNEVIVSTKSTLEEAIDTAKKFSRLSSQLIFIRSVKIEYDDMCCYQLGKLKY